jgi:hypothetical protein
VTETPTAASKRAALSRELSEFLIELSIGVHRYAMYPQGHPSLAPVVENIVGRLGELFVDRHTLSIGVAQRQLLIEGVATDEKHPVLADLARRLHGHQLGAFAFERGVNASAVSGFLLALATDSDRGGVPLGMLPPESFPHWDHVKLYRVGYEHLEISDAAGGGDSVIDRATRLWLSLAQAVLVLEAPPEELPDASALAQGIEGHQRETAYDQVIAGYLVQLAEELKTGRGGDAEKIRRRVSKLLGELDEATLGRLVGIGGNPAQRRRFLLDANQSLAVDSVMKVLQAAATSPGQTISHSMTRLLSKLAAHAEQGRGALRSQADTALRENIESLIEGWELKDPNPDQYTNVLDFMAHAVPIFHTPAGDDDDLSGAQRLVQMALEVDAYGPLVDKAVTDLLEGGGAGPLLRMLQKLDEDNGVAARVRDRLTDPSHFRHLLADGHLDGDSLATLLEQMGSGGIDPLLDVLADSDSRSVRRLVFDALIRMGPMVGQRAVERLKDGRWFVLRNMLSLIQRLEHVPGDFDAYRYLDHPDPRVRREAMPLAIRKTDMRERILVSALSDPDERMVRMGLLELRDQIPDPVLPTLVNRVLRGGTRTSPIRTLAVRVLSVARSPLALSALLDLVTSGRTIFGKTRISSASSEVLAGLRVLAERWSDHPEVKEVIHLAARSKDPEIRGAVHVRQGGAA